MPLFCASETFINHVSLKVKTPLEVLLGFLNFNLYLKNTAFIQKIKDFDAIVLLPEQRRTKETWRKLIMLPILNGDQNAQGL